MDELSPLFQDIEFRERLRGYDVEEVDAYIDRVARAAALVQGRIAELQQRAEAAESREAPRPTVVEGEETMSRVLLLAQRTADAAVAEAQAEASEVLARAHAEAAATRADADEYASRVLAEAETDRRRAVADAETAAAEAIAHERERVTDAIAELEQYRAFLTEDIDILERHLADSRSTLAASLSGLADLLETPEAFRAPAMPATSGAIAPAVLDEPVAHLDLTDATAEFEPILDAAVAPEAEHEPEIAPDLELAPDPETVPEPEAAPEPEMAVAPTPDVAPEPVLSTEEAAPEYVDAPVVAEWAAPASDQDVVVDDEPLLVEDATIADVEPATDAEPAATDDIDLTTPPIDLAPQPAPEIVPPPLLVTAADLDAAEAGDDWMRDLHVESGPITEPVPMVADQLLFEDPSAVAPTTAADPFLEQLREAVARGDSEEFGDDALAAFFDSEGDDGGRSWFPKRR